MQATSVLEAVWNEELPPHWHVNLLGGLNFPVPLPRYGLYAFEILLNDSNAKTIPLRVVPAGHAPGGRILNVCVPVADQELIVTAYWQ